MTSSLGHGVGLLLVHCDHQVPTPATYSALGAKWFLKSVES